MATRLTQLYTTGVPFPFKVEFACKVRNHEEVETALHIAFGPNRVNPRREFFQIEPAQAIAILKLLHTEDATQEVQHQAETAPIEEQEAGERYLGRRPNFKFPEMGVPIGAQIHFVESDVTALVTAPARVQIHGEEMSLTAVTRKLLGLDYSVQPARYWTYNGKNLRDMYEETYTNIPE